MMHIGLKTTENYRKIPNDNDNKHKRNAERHSFDDNVSELRIC
jgi:hypothetical protein